MVMLSNRLLFFKISAGKLSMSNSELSPKDQVHSGSELPNFTVKLKDDFNNLAAATLLISFNSDMIISTILIRQIFLIKWVRCVSGSSARQVWLIILFMTLLDVF
jgi:hypothetical protein